MRKTIVGIEFGNKKPYMIIPNAIPIVKIEYEAISSDRYVWDYFQCFRPSSDLGYANGTLYKVEDLDPKTIEYRYVAYKFGKTRNGRNDDTLSIKKTVKNMMAEGLPAEANNIKRI